jgi:hypothetical protein
VLPATSSNEEVVESILALKEYQMDWLMTYQFGAHIIDWVLGALTLGASVALNIDARRMRLGQK